MLSITPDANDEQAKITVTLPYAPSSSLTFIVTPPSSATAIAQRYLDHAHFIHVRIQEIIDILMSRKEPDIPSPPEAPGK